MESNEWEVFRFTLFVISSFFFLVCLYGCANNLDIDCPKVFHLVSFDLLGVGCQAGCGSRRGRCGLKVERI